MRSVFSYLRYLRIVSKEKRGFPWFHCSGTTLSREANNLFYCHIKGGIKFHGAESSRAIRRAMRRANASRRKVSRDLFPWNDSVETGILRQSCKSVDREHKLPPGRAYLKYTACYLFPPGDTLAQNRSCHPLKGRNTNDIDVELREG